MNEGTQSKKKKPKCKVRNWRRYHCGIYQAHITINGNLRTQPKMKQRKKSYHFMYIHVWCGVYTFGTSNNGNLVEIYSKTTQHITNRLYNFRRIRNDRMVCTHYEFIKKYLPCHFHHIHTIQTTCFRILYTIICLS